MFKIVTPFPAHHLELIFTWAMEYPSANLDDYAPKTSKECLQALQYRFGVRDEDGTAVGGENDNPERSWAIYVGEGPAYPYDGTKPCGLVGYLPMTPRLGVLHGILFSQGKIGREDRRAALGQIISELFGSGVEKISASYFASNRKVHKFLEDLGFIPEGIFRKHTLQNGVPIDLIQVALFKTMDGG